MIGIASVVIMLLLIAAYYDFTAREIPNWISALIAGLFMVSALVFLESGIFLDGLKLAGPVFIGSFALFAIGQLGGGDVKLLTATALWSGASYALDFLVITAFAGGILSLAYLIRSKVAIATPDGSADTAQAPIAVPYGIAIAIGTTVVLVDRSLT